MAKQVQLEALDKYKYHLIISERQRQMLDTALIYVCAQHDNPVKLGELRQKLANIPIAELAQKYHMPQHPFTHDLTEK